MATYKFRIIKKPGDILLEKLLPGCETCIHNPGTINCPLSGEKRVKSSNTNDFLEMQFCSNAAQDIRNPGLLRSKMELIFSIFDAISEKTKTTLEEEKKKLRRLFHNVTSLNAHNIQELYALIPQDSLLKAREQKAQAERYIRQNPRDASESFLRVAKNCSGIKTEIDVFQKIHSGNHIPSPGNHRIHSLLLNILYVFFTDFTDKHVYINVEESEINVYLDFESIRIALYHFFQNAEKYCLPEKEIDIKFKVMDRYCYVEISMVSLFMTENDINKLYNDDYSGEYSMQLKKNGHGIGMGVIRDMLRLNNSTLTIQAGKTPTVNFETIPYANNKFIFKFPTRKADWQ